MVVVFVSGKRQSQNRTLRTLSGSARFRQNRLRMTQMLWISAEQRESELTTFWSLLALAHWFDIRGPSQSMVGLLISTISFALFILIGLLRISTLDKRKDFIKQAFIDQARLPLQRPLISLQYPSPGWVIRRSRSKFFQRDRRSQCPRL